MKIVLATLSLFSGAALIGGSYAGAMKIMDDANKKIEEQKKLAYDNSDAYVLVKSTKSLRTSSQPLAASTAENYKCYWGVFQHNKTENITECKLLEITFDQTKKSVEINEEKIQEFTEQSYENLKTMVQSTDANLGDKYYLAKIKRKQVPLVKNDLSVVVGNANETLNDSKIKFSVMGSFEHDWKFLGSGDAVVAKLLSVENADINEGEEEEDSEDGAGASYPSYKCALSETSDNDFNTCWISKINDSGKTSINTSSFSNFIKTSVSTTAQKFNFTQSPDNQMFSFSLNSNSSLNLKSTNLIGKKIYVTELSKTDNSKIKKAIFEITQLLLWDQTKTPAKEIIVIK